MMRLEFWPDYGPGPLWNDEGTPTDLGSLGISPELAERVRVWSQSLGGASRLLFNSLGFRTSL